MPNGYVKEYVVCVRSEVRKAGAEPVETQITLDELMRQNGGPLMDEFAGDPVTRSTSEAVEEAGGGAFPKGDTPPSSFDWRDYNGHAYIGSVRNQGSCGSCYAFGACAAAEGAYNKSTGNYYENCHTARGYRCDRPGGGVE